MNKIQIIYYVVSAFFTIAGVVFGIVYKIKGGKWRKVAEAASTIADGMTSLGDQFSTLSGLIKKAEGFKNYTGAEKLNYVLTNYKLDCLNNGIKYDEAAATEQIESIIDLTKAVNAKKTVNVIDKEG